WPNGPRLLSPSKGAGEGKLLSQRKFETLTPAPEPAAIEIARYDLQHDLAETFNRLRPGFGIGALDALALILRQLALEIDPGGRELQQALAAVAFAGVLNDEALAHQLA